MSGGLEKSLSGEDMMTEPNQAMIDRMQEVMAEKAAELFRLCDHEGKGYITKSDMQRLQQELPVSQDQLEVVFDSLDNDGNGSLTLDEFTDGFGSFLGLRTQSSRDELEDGGQGQDVYEGESGEIDPALEERQFAEMMRHIGATQIFLDEDVIRAMWQKLHREEPDMASTFEEFLSRLSGDIKKSKVDFQSLEAALQSKNNEHEEEVKKLYEEMESQIKQEREKILAEEKMKEKQIKGELEQQVQEKERQLQEILTRHQEMEQKLEQLNKMETATKHENERLQKEKYRLEEMLSQSQDDLEESRTYIQQMQLQQKDEKRERARAALMLSEGIAIERESLVKQLDLLKDVNKRLRDDKDEAEATEARREGKPLSLEEELKAGQAEEGSEERAKPKPARKELHKQGSVLSKYFPGGRAQKRSSDLGSFELDLNTTMECDDDEIDIDDGDLDEQALQGANILMLSSGHPDQHRHSGEESGEEGPGQVGAGGEDGGEDGSSHDGEKKKRKFRFHTKRSQPVGADAQVSAETSAPKPQRIFKVVFVGDSGVGKSTFIHRFCHQEFRPSFAATIGVDFQIKTMDSRNTTCILQLWDTAGQERYRSLTNAYFRKADGVIIMYDVTSEKTFTSVRNWMGSVQTQVEPGTVIALLGNKMDMTEDDAYRPVKEKDGMALAAEYEALFYETSAKSGANIQEAMEALTSWLQEKEDKKMEDGLNLLETGNKKRCCSR